MAVPENTYKQWPRIIIRTVGGAALPLLALAVGWSVLSFADGAGFVLALLWPVWLLFAVLTMLACNLSPWFRRITYATCLLCLAVLVSSFVVRRLQL
jgi:hypothetical protein